MTPTPQALLQALLDGIRQALGGQFAGMYLHGSLATGAFDPDRSDVDFLVVTWDKLPPDLLQNLASLHARLFVSGLPWATNYEGSYIPGNALRRYDPADCVHPAVEVDGSFGLAVHGTDWVVQRHILREHGISLAGPPARELIDPISPDELRLAVRVLIQERWARQHEDPSRLQSSEYQAYAVLTMCRMWYTLEEGAVASKRQAARWAMQRLEDRWHPLVEEALAWRHGMGMDRLDDTLAFIQRTTKGALT